MVLKKILIILIFLVFLFSFKTSSALNLTEVSVNPEEIWVGGSVEITAKCQDGDELDVFIYILKTGETEKMSEVNGTFKITYTPSSAGRYNFTIFCSNENETVNASGSFLVSNLKLILEDIPSFVYTDEALTIEANLYKVNEIEEKIRKNVKFHVFLDGKEVAVDDEKTFFNLVKDSWKIVTSNLSDIEPAEYTFELQAIYEEREVSNVSSIEVKAPLELEIHPEKEWTVGGESFKINYSARYRSQPITLSSSDIKVKIGEEEVSIDDVDGNEILITTPLLEPGSYDLIVKIYYKNLEAKSRERIRYVLPVEGEIIDVSGNFISGSLTFFAKSGGFKRISITSGKYSGYLDNGTYDLKVSLPKISVTFYDVLVNDELKNILRYDSPSTAPGLEGFKVSSAVALEFKLPFTKATVEMKYDASKVKNEEELEVFVCHEWNLDARYCSGSWEKLNASIDTIDNEVRFQITSLSAFVVGERKQLDIECDLEKESYFAGEPIDITGVVRDETGKTVKDVIVKVSIGNQNVEDRTNEDGVFSLTLLTPEEEGEYEISIEASKEPFKEGKKELSFRVEKKKDFTLLVPTSINVIRGESYKYNLTVLNNGQTTLKNFIVDISGAPSYFDFQPKKWKELKPGEDFQIKLDFKVESADRREYLVSVRVRSDELEKKDSFVLIVENKTTEERKGLTFPTFNLPSGMFVLPKDATSLINVLSLIISVVIIILLLRGFIKRIRGEKRKYIKTYLEELKEEIKRK